MILRFCALGVALVSLAACGGGGGGTTTAAVTYPDLTNTTNSSGSVTVLTVAGTGPSATAATGSGTFSNGTVTSGSGTATASTAGLTAGLTNVATIAPGGTVTNATLVADQTQAGDMPTTGTLNYSGRVQAQINDGTNTYDARLNATMTADLGAGTLSVNASGLDSGFTATQTNGAGVTTNYTAGGNEALTLTGATIDTTNGTFSGGTGATVTNWNGNANNALTGTVTANSSGVFAGSQADEVAGNAVASGSTGGWYNATFAGD